MQAFFESLEGRTLFSATPVMVPDAVLPLATPHASVMASAVAASTSATTAATALAKMVGKWKGSVKIPGVHTQSVTLTIAKQSSTGKLTGTLIANANKSIKVVFTGVIKATRKVTIKLVGGHSGGAINGSGSGTLSSTGKSITFKMTFVQGGQKFPGTLTLKLA